MAIYASYRGWVQKRYQKILFLMPQTRPLGCVSLKWYESLFQTEYSGRWFAIGVLANRLRIASSRFIAMLFGLFKIIGDLIDTSGPPPFFAKLDFTKKLNAPQTNCLKLS